MTPGEVKGYALQVLSRKELTKEEKQAVRFLLDSLELTLKIAPIIEKANKELESVEDSDSGASAAVPRGGADPNTGWEG